MCRLDWFLLPKQVYLYCYLEAFISLYSNPNTPVPVKVNWPASDNSDLPYMALDVGSKLSVGHGVVHHECVFINRILPMILKGNVLFYDEM